uniref:Transposase n=1 Tax=Acrobeloides nanus TaxID=290746 RepID=A0A914DZ13_9BILA
MNIGERMVYRTIKRYQETGSAKDKRRSGRPITARTPVNKREIKGRIQRNLENEACSKPHQSIEALKKSLVAAWNKIPQDVIDKAVDNFSKRLKKCIDAQGGHFEDK